MAGSGADHTATGGCRQPIGLGEQEGGGGAGRAGGGSTDALHIQYRMVAAWPTAGRIAVCSVALGWVYGPRLGSGPFSVAQTG